MRSYVDHGITFEQNRPRRDSNVYLQMLTPVSHRRPPMLTPLFREDRKFITSTFRLIAGQVALPLVGAVNVNKYR